MAEHLHCRAKAALFDVSHMGQAMLAGATAPAALERLVPGDVSGLKPGRQRYTLLMNEAGGIIDDMMVANLGSDRLFLVVNAARRGVDLPHIAAALPESVRLTALEDRALLALQGPAAAACWRRCVPDAAALPFMGVAETQIAGMPCPVSRSGYTGEDGFEISVPADSAAAVADRLLESGAGGARRPRRAGFAAARGRALPLRQRHRRAHLAGGSRADLGHPAQAAGVAGDFPGAAVVRDQLENGPARQRVGFRPEGRAPARAGTEIVADDGTAAGTVTSGGFSPTLNAPIAMGYVRRDLAAPGTRLHLMIRGKPQPATVCPLPFVPHAYAK